MTSAAAPRNALLVIGIGSPLREDDRVGLFLLERLKEYFGEGFHGIIVYEPDISLAETISSYSTLLVIDALVTEPELPFRMFPLPPAATIFPGGGLSSHLFDWGMVLAMARDLFGHAPESFVCGVRARNFGFSEEISPQCRADAEEAFVMLCDFVKERGGRIDQEMGASGNSSSVSPLSRIS